MQARTQRLQYEAIVKAMLQYLAHPNQMDASARRIGFNVYFSGGNDPVREVCSTAGWLCTNQRAEACRVLNIIAENLHEQGFLDRYEVGLLPGEARLVPSYAYEMPFKHRAKLNPDAWPGYLPDWTPERELDLILQQAAKHDLNNFQPLMQRRKH